MGGEVLTYVCALLDSKYLRSLLWILNRICMEIKNWILHYDDDVDDIVYVFIFVFVQID